MIDFNNLKIGEIKPCFTKEDILMYYLGYKEAMDDILLNLRFNRIQNIDDLKEYINFKLMLNINHYLAKEGLNIE